MAGCSASTDLAGVLQKLDFTRKYIDGPRRNFRKEPDFFGQQRISVKTMRTIMIF